MTQLKKGFNNLLVVGGLFLATILLLVSINTPLITNDNILNETTKEKLTASLVSQSNISITILSLSPQILDLKQLMKLVAF